MFGAKSRKEKELFEAVLKNDVSQLMLLIEDKVDVNALNEDGESPLLLAKSPQIKRLLLEAGAKHNIRNKNGLTPLHFAVYNNQLQIVSLLLAKGANPNAIDADHQTPLFYSQSVEVLNTLIKAGADVNAKNEYGETFLHYLESFDMAKALIEAGIDIHSLDNHEDNPEPAFLRCANAQIEQLLLDNGVHLKEIIKDYPYILNRLHSKNTVIEALKEGANILTEDPRVDYSPLFNASNAEVLKTLIYAGADILKADKEEWLISGFFNEREFAKCKIYCFEGANPSFYDKQFDMFIEEYNKDLLELLVGAGADITIKDKEGISFLEYLKKRKKFKEGLYAKDISEEEYQVELDLTKSKENFTKNDFTGASEVLEMHSKCIQYIESLLENPTLIEKAKNKFEAEKEQYFKEKANEEAEIKEALKGFVVKNNEKNDSKTPVDEKEKSPKIKSEYFDDSEDDAYLEAVASQANIFIKKSLKTAKTLYYLYNDSEFWDNIEVDKNYAILNKLFDFGLKTELNRKNSVGTPLLHVLFNQDEINYFEKLLKAGADPDIRDKNGNSILHLIIKNSKFDFLRIALKYKASMYCVNNDKKSVEDLAEKGTLMEKELYLLSLNQ